MRTDSQRCYETWPPSGISYGNPRHSPVCRGLRDLLWGTSYTRPWMSCQASYPNLFNELDEELRNVITTITRWSGAAGVSTIFNTYKVCVRDDDAAQRYTARHSLALGSSWNSDEADLPHQARSRRMRPHSTSTQDLPLSMTLRTSHKGPGRSYSIHRLPRIRLVN